MHEIVFIGSSAYGLDCLIENGNFKPLEVICLEKRVTPTLESTTQRHGLPLVKVEWKKEFGEAIKKHPLSRPFFIYQLDMLVPAALTEEYTFFNVHRGDLKTNRGPSPDIWPVLNGDFDSALSLHKINDKVDSGVFVGEYRVPLAKDETVPSLKSKLEVGLPKLIRDMDDYLSGRIKGHELVGGTYRPWITEQDFTIDLSNDPLEVIERKVRSQKTYNGAIVHFMGEKFYVNDVQVLDHGETIGLNRSEETLTLDTCNGILKFNINANPKYAPPPVMKPSKRI